MSGYQSLWRKAVLAGWGGVLTVLVLGLFQPAAGSAPNEPSAREGLKPLSLTEAQGLALGRNWDLLAAAAGVNLATAQKIVSHEFPNPTLSLSASKINVDHHPNSTPAGNGLWERSYDTVVAINQLFEIGGKRRYRQLSAQAGLEGARAQFLDAKRTLDLAVARAYISAAQAEESARVLSQSTATLRQEAQLAETRFKAGEVSAADKAQIEINAERFETSARTAEAAAAQARISLELLLGVPRPEGRTALADRLEVLAGLPAPSSSRSNVLVTVRADVAAAGAAARKADADVRLQRAMRIPDPTLLAQYEHEPPDAPNSVGFGVNFPLPLWNRNRGNILAAESAREQARLAYEKAAAQAAAEVATARLIYEEASRRWEQYRQGIVPKSEQVRQTKAYAYKQGGASLLDMLVAERDDNEVRLAALQAASDAASAWAALKAATTTIQPSEVLK